MGGSELFGWPIWLAFMRVFDVFAFVFSLRRLQLAQVLSGRSRPIAIAHPVPLAAYRTAGELPGH